MQARNLAERDLEVLGGLSDPFVVVTADPASVIIESESQLKSSVKPHDINPEWDDSLSVTIRTSDLEGLSLNAHLIFEVWDSDNKLTNDLVGLCAVPFSAILAAVQKEESFAIDSMLTCAGQNCGYLMGTIKCQAPIKDKWIETRSGKSSKINASRKIFHSPKRVSAFDKKAEQSCIEACTIA
jgi:Ca2+-dependent lipid-binding protein